MTSRPVRVRIAPSPTGDPHVGTAYIGLFNMIFARQNQGSFVLRIEDTDQTRSTKQSEDAIYRSLRWVGLTWNEGPDVGGPFGPYRQSERTEIYQSHCTKLLESQHAYRCFCSAERLDRLREEQRRMKLPTKYDGRCRELTTEEVSSRMQGGEPFVIRLKTPGVGTTTVHDLLRGQIQYENTQIDDQVLLKSDGFPTYHLANVVDDHLMEITHVIRAEEWIPSTPKHIMLYEAFGWEMPTFVHMPLLRNADRSKISKRKNPVSLEFFRKAGFLPEAMLNFLAMMGWSMPNDQEKFSLEEMTGQFTWDRMSLSGPVFNLEKLEWLNGLYLRDLSVNDLKQRVMAEIFPDTLVTEIIGLIQERMRRLDEFVPLASFFFTTDIQTPAEQIVPKGMDKKLANRVIRELSELLDNVTDWKSTNIESILRTYVDEHPDVTIKQVFMLSRIVSTGRTASPPLFETMETMGKALCQDRFRRALSALKL